MPRARRFFGAAELGGLVYAVGGELNASTLAAVDVFDPVSRSWFTTGSLNAARQHHGVAVLNGSLWVAGGMNAFGTHMNTLEEYAPGGSVWLNRAALPVARTYLSLTASQGKLYAIGGAQSNSPILTDRNDTYDPTTNTWSARAPIPSPRGHMALVTGPDGKIFAFGGRNDTMALALVEAYDPTTNSWSARTPMSAPRSNASATLLGGRIYVVGGVNGSQFVSTVEIYDPATDSWQTGQALPSARSSLGLAGLGQHLYSVGGNNGNALASLEDGTVLLAATPSPTSVATAASTATQTPTVQSTVIATSSSTATSTSTTIATATKTNTPSPTSTSTPTVIPATATATQTPTVVPPTATRTPTIAPPTVTATRTPTMIPPTATATPTPPVIPPTVTATSSPTVVAATATSTYTPTVILPTVTATRTPTQAAAPTPTLGAGQTYLTANTILSPTQPEVLATGHSPSSVTINVPLAVANPILNFTGIMSPASTAVTLPGQTNVVVQTGAGTVTLQMAPGTSISGPGWNGKLLLPQWRSAATLPPPPGGSLPTNLTGAVELGAPGLNLDYSQAIRITFPGRGGQLVGVVAGGTVTPVTGICSGDSQPAGNALPAGAACAISVGTDLAVWTKHTTMYVTYASACTPRSQNLVQSAATGDGRLRVTVQAQPMGPGAPAAELKELQFTRLSNALVDVAPQLGMSTPTTVALGRGATSITFYVRRLTAGQGTTVELTIVDSCGSWKTFVGGGPATF
ncbi:MAG: Kelch repeat-containing protein [Chloroflexota bacterium]